MTNGRVQGADLNVVGAASLAVVHDTGTSRRGTSQGQLDLVHDAAVAIRNGEICAVGPTSEVLADWGHHYVPQIDAAGKTVLPGLVECHSHPLFGGHRHHEYAERLAGASLAEVAARGGGIWSSVQATRDASDDELLQRLDDALHRMVRGGVTCAEVKSGYGLTVETELHQLELLRRAQLTSPIDLVITFLGAHVVPRDLEPADGVLAADAYSDLVAGEMTRRVLEQGIAAFQDVTVEDGLFTPAQAERIIASSHAAGLRTRVHADAWKPSLGWRTACAAGAISADHLTYTSDDEIDAVGATDTVAVVLPVAELIYMTDRRANARRLIDTGVPVAISTDYCSSIHATSLLSTMTMAAPWFRITPAEAVVGATLNAAYSLGVQTQRGSLDVGKLGDLLILDCPHPDELFLGLADEMLTTVVLRGSVYA
jgi:imidazolonepropionase